MMDSDNIIRFHNKQHPPGTISLELTKAIDNWIDESSEEMSEVAEYLLEYARPIFEEYQGRLTLVASHGSNLTQEQIQFVEDVGQIISKLLTTIAGLRLACNKIEESKY